jgi:hypothetical protein
MKENSNHLDGIDCVTTTITGLSFKPTKYKIHFKTANIAFMFIDLTWKQKMFFKWFLDGTLTKLEE